MGTVRQGDSLGYPEDQVGDGSSKMPWPMHLGEKGGLGGLPMEKIAFHSLSEPP